MPVISKFYGIAIKMYFRLFAICDGEMIEGDLPQKVQQLVREFIDHYRERLMQMWENQDFEILPPIE